jgi:hypothetical protein
LTDIIFISLLKIKKAMKTISKITLLLFISLSISCSKTDYDCLGCQDDTIGLSKTLVQFSAENNSATITTKGGEWWLSEISFDGNKIDVSGLQREAYPLKIEEQDFTFERKNANEIFIQMTKNTSGKERKIWILLTHLNRGSHLNIKQSAQ